MNRIKPSNRRTGITIKIEVADLTVHATANFGLDGKPIELFLPGPKPGSPIATLLEDAAVVISVALQHGIPATALAKSMARVPASPIQPSGLADPKIEVPTAPATVIGAALTWLARLTDNPEAMV